MGFMSLFSRKGRLDRQQGGRSPKSQPYDSTVASQPPTRGAFPVAGNGPNMIQSLSRSTRFTQSQHSLSDASAPSPTVLRFKDEDLGFDRPRTAPDRARGQRADPGMDRSQKRTSMKASPLSYRPPVRGDSFVAAPQAASTAAVTRLATQATLKPLPATPRRPFSHIPHAHSRTFSLRSEVGKGFVDLLDAQSEITPTDFRSRVQATGARDYGEDVAERNLGQNGVDLQSSQVQAFYAVDAPAQVVEPPRTPLGASRAGPRRLDLPTSGPPESGLAKPLNSPHAFAFPQRASSAVPGPPRTSAPQNTLANTSRPVTGPTSRALKRQSLNTYLYSPELGVMNSPQFKTRPMSFHRGGRSVDQRLHISATRANQHAPGWDTNSPDTDSMSPPVVHSAKQVPSPRAARDRALAFMKKTGTEKPAIVPTDRFQFQFQSHQDEQAAARPRSSRGSVASSTFPSHHRDDSRKGSSLHTIHSSVSSSMTYRETPTDFTPLAHPKPPRRGSKTAEDVDMAAVGRGRDTQPTYTISSQWRDEGRDEAGRYPRTKSLTSLPRPPFDELEDIPPRSSSIRNWSMTSATPTTSSTSSHTFARSAHTANTSVDLSNAYPSGRPSSRSSANSGHGRQSFYTAREVSASPHKVTSPGFNIDDYLSSDDDSFTAPDRPRAAGEEHLLFKVDGYGMSASQLPGLLDGMSAPAPEIRSHRPRSCASLPAENLRQAFSYPKTSGRGVRQRKYAIHPNVADDDYYDNDLSETLSADGGDDALLATIPGLFSGAGHQDGRRHTRRISALGGHRGHGRYDSVSDQVIEEERLEKVDIATAVRMRKEAKAKKRALLMPDRHRGESPYRAAAKGKAVARETGDPDDADVEQ